ncbi:MAG: cellulose biosynthesis cyclic di-GMP-binding regulatory protein BcsB [Mucilaginibacter sp.]|uniref:cellulose biosynthesis cyclic di-GMP-binding regulatory protein BcsB n=1 Tax=Mucilaginibacter sp. L3T2-6 TaxID=3062491 RepID=UPI00267458F3|nr:cellulose biosynthesis cyclic di-GMP-binding regulatory protein BcsB [Mucilaginibacter sp. L3T2-6]MDO3645081.1 cellulose biosynthesis cyclic di-GMP-binding regulatory protein BcsB [Mucilaginibacter sp. L3T2-6]MDV6217532.1 cellulose biosynthesis cyclic di-GMP-binding regulatory protein BcsB [Mucilaginibacter sp. L3T2-6]
MNKFFTLLALVFLLSKASLAQSIVSFKSLGHDDDAIYGMSGASSFYVKISPLVEMNGSKLVLYFEPSQALLKDHSFINIIINDRPVYSSRLGADSVQKVTLNLTRENLSADHFLKIQVKTLLTITDDICKDLDNPAMWLKVKNYSYLSLVKNKAGLTDVNISNCFESKRAIVYPAEPSLNDLKAVAWAYARLKRTNNKKILVYPVGQLPDSIKNYIQVGTLGALPEDKRSLIKVSPQSNEGILYLSKSMSTSVDTITTMVNQKGVMVPQKSVATESSPAEILFVSGGDDAGYDKAITALGNINILNSTFGDYLLIDKAENTFFKNTDQNRSKLSLKQIGGSSDFLSGIGSLKSAFTFKNSDFNFTPKEVEIRFIGNYSGLNPGDRGYFNIYLNGLLISSEKLDASGKLNTSVTINRYQHHKYNTLEAEFRFFPTNGLCKNSFINFFGEVDADKSYLESKNPFISNDLSFYQYPEAFNTGTTKIVVTKEYAKYAAGAIGEIIYELNNNINSNNFPEFAYSSDVPDGDLKKYNIIALLSKDDQLLKKFPDAPISFEQNFRIYSTENHNKVYALSDTTSNGLAQIFYGRSNNATLVITATGSHISDAFLAASRSITEQLSTLSSNVCVTDANSNKYLFNINKSSDNVEYVDTKNAITRFWEQYNLYILLGILVLILLSFLFVRSRVQRSQELYND